MGTVENSTLFGEFSKRCGNSGKTRFVFPRFPQRVSFHSPGFRLSTEQEQSVFEKYFVGGFEAKRFARPIVESRLYSLHLGVSELREIRLLGKVLPH